MTARIFGTIGVLFVIPSVISFFFPTLWAHGPSITPVHMWAQASHWFTSYGIGVVVVFLALVWGGKG